MGDDWVYWHRHCFLGNSYFDLPALTRTWSTEEEEEDGDRVWHWRNKLDFLSLWEQKLFWAWELWTLFLNRPREESDQPNAAAIKTLLREYFNMGTVFLGHTLIVILHDTTHDRCRCDDDDGPIYIRIKGAHTEEWLSSPLIDEEVLTRLARLINFISPDRPTDQTSLLSRTAQQHWTIVHIVRAQKENRTRSWNSGNRESSQSMAN